MVLLYDVTVWESEIISLIHLLERPDKDSHSNGRPNCFHNHIHIHKASVGSRLVRASRIPRGLSGVHTAREKDL